MKENHDNTLDGAGIGTVVGTGTGTWKRRQEKKSENTKSEHSYSIGNFNMWKAKLINIEGAKQLGKSHEGQQHKPRKEQE